MTRINKLLLVLAAAASLGSLAFAVDSTATSNQPGPRDGRDRVERLLRFATHRLELTETQRAALKEVLQLHQPELQPLIAQAREQRKELRTLVSAPALDEVALEAQAAKIAETTRQLTIAQAHLRVDMRAILTPEQVGKIAKARGAMAHRRHQARDGFNRWLVEP